MARLSLDGGDLLLLDGTDHLLLPTVETETNLSPATLTLSGVALSPFAGGFLTLAPAVLVLSGVAVTGVPQPAVIALSPAVLVLTAVALPEEPGEITVELEPAVVVLSGVVLSPASGGVANAFLSAAVIGFLAVPVGPVALPTGVVAGRFLAFLERNVTVIPRVVDGRDASGDEVLVDGGSFETVCSRDQIERSEIIADRDEQTEAFRYFFPASTIISGYDVIVDGEDRLFVRGPVERLIQRRTGAVHHLEVIAVLRKG